MQFPDAIYGVNSMNRVNLAEKQTHSLVAAMKASFAWCVVLSALIAASENTIGEQPKVQSEIRKTETHKAAEEDKHPFTVRVVDPDGKPVADAEVGNGAGNDGGPGSEWMFLGFFKSEKWHPFVTDASGTIQIPAESLSRGSLALVARKTARKLVGIKLITRNEVATARENNSAITTSLQPECRVHAAVQSVGLEHLGQHLKRFVAYVESDRTRLFTFLSGQRELEFFLPAGTYSLRVYGSDTTELQRMFTVPEARTSLELDAFDLPPTNMAKIIGQPAPEIADVLAWKNSKPLKMADLRGKYVLLDFFGFWCGPCVHAMPNAFNLHDRFSRRGLVIIGVHVGLDDDSIDSADNLDAKLADVRKELWGGRDIPFPVAMVASHRTKFTGSERTGRSQAAVDYGVLLYPSQVLIDPEGKALRVNKCCKMLLAAKE